MTVNAGAIPAEELFEVARVTLEAAEQLRVQYVHSLAGISIL